MRKQTATLATSRHVKTTSKVAIERFAEIAEMIGDRQSFNCTAIAKQFEVSTKTALRDLEYMRDRLGIPLEYDRKTHAYRLGDTPPPAVLAFLKLAAPAQIAARRQAANWMKEAA